MLLLRFPKQLLEAAVSIPPSTVLGWTIPDLHPNSPGRTFVNSTGLESVGSVQATMSLVGLEGVLFPVLYFLNYKNNAYSLRKTNKHTPFSYLLRGMSIDSLVFASTQFSVPTPNPYMDNFAFYG